MIRPILFALPGNEIMAMESAVALGAELGRRVSMTEVDAVLRREFETLFGKTA